MDRAARALRTRWTEVLFVTAVLGAIAFACGPTQLAPLPGVVEFMAPARLAAPGGFVNAAGGNYFHERIDLELDTRLGPFSIGAVYNSSWGWTWSFDATFKNGTLRDSTGARTPMAALANGAAAPGTHWVKVDATRVKTKGGLLHEFDATTSRLITLRFTSSAYPRLRFNQQQIGAVWRTSGIDQCTSATACAPFFTLSYDAAARLTRIEDHAGRTALFSYDAQGRLVSARDGLDVAKDWPGERYEYAGAFVSAITNSEGERIELASDSAGRTTQVRAVGAGDPTWRFTYGLPNASGVSTTIALDPLGHASTLAVDSSYRVQSVANPLGERIDFTWSGQRPASRTLPDGTRTSWTWANDDVATETLPSGNVRTLTYQADGVNRVQPETRPIASIRDSIGAVETRSYDADGRLRGVTNGASETTTFTYGADEAIASIARPDGSMLHFRQYGEHGRASEVGLDGFHWTTQSFDAVGNTMRSAEPAPYSGGVTELHYDADRNVAEISVIDRPLAPAPASEQTITLEYRSDRQPSRVLRPYGGETVFAHDALGRVIEQRERVSPTALPANAWSTTRFSHDALGRITAVELANGMRSERSYDAAGRTAGARSLEDGVVDSELLLAYAQGRLVLAHSPDGSFDEALSYDGAGRLRAVRHTLGETTRLAYDERSRAVRTEFEMPDGSSLAALVSGYDAADRETQFAALATDLVTRTYANGRLSSTVYGNGLRRASWRTTRHGLEDGREMWRGSNRIEKSDYTRGTEVAPELQATTTTFSQSGAFNATRGEQFGFASNESPPGADRRLAVAMSSSGFAEQFSYDHLSSLRGLESTEQNPFWFSPFSVSVVFNAEHNRALAVHRSGWSGSAHEYAFDAAGFAVAQSRATQFAGSPVVTSFDWNAASQIVSIATDGVVDALFSYDAIGRRRSLQANGVTRRWRFGGAVEANAADVPVVIDLGEVRIALSGSHRFRHADARGNTQYATNMAGQIESVNVYSAYGERGTIGAGDADFGFARGTHIATAGGEFVRLGARLLDPRSARFLSPDPVWNPFNAFSYTLGNPVDFWDETGLHPGHAGGSSDHKDIELQRTAVVQATAIAVTAAVVAKVAPNVGTIGAAIAAAANLAAEQANLHTLEQFHEQDYPVSLPPEVGAPPSEFFDGGFPLTGFDTPVFYYGTPVVVCDGDAC